MTPQIDIIRTKLHRPPVTKDLVPRTALLNQLDRYRQRPLTLVSAPAGYGKSTLASSWLDTCECPGAWVSLDADDSDLRGFLTYLAAAIQMLFPKAIQQTQALLKATELPPGKVLARMLLNELAQLEKSFILVLDDYHRIRELAIHDLLKKLLNHPPPALHLVLVTRHNPPLSLTTLRARGQMTEIREQDLRFSTADTMDFLHQAMALPVDAQIAAVLNDWTEGWVTGLRLAILSMRRQEDMDRILPSLSEENRHITEYLISEVLSQQPADISHYLFSTAILNRFCASLCEAACVGDGREACPISGQAFLDWLEQTNLFVTPLDDRQHWFRYHHMFQKLLQYRMHAQKNPEEISALHQRASGWFAEQGLIDEALQHALKAEDTAAAINLVAHYRHLLMNQEQWPRLESWLRLFSDKVIARHPELLLIKAWVFQKRLRLFDIPTVLNQVESLLAAMPLESATPKYLYGELAVLRSYQYFNAANGHRVVTFAQQALERLPEESLYARSGTVTMLGLGYQMTGDFTSATTVVYQTLQDDAFHHTASHTRLLVALCFIYWIEADLTGFHQAATQHLKLSKDFKLPESRAIARYFLGIYHYQRNDLAAAEHILYEAVNSSSSFNSINFGFSTFALALTYQAKEQPEDACEAVDKIMAFAMEAGNTTLLSFARAFQAELALRQGDLAQAASWAQRYDPFPLLPMTRAYLPQLTYVKVLLAQATPNSRQQAAELLEHLQDYYEGIHNRRFVIEILALQALLVNYRGDQSAALSALERAIALAGPGGCIRLFVDLGLTMAQLLKRLMSRNIALRYIGQILAAFRHEELNAEYHTFHQPIAPSSSLDFQPLIDDLTKRESEI
ncbi:MAG: hypothetical protein GY794_07545, partial [bacterium]|nr:hypothetical protein [bacterium]